MDQEHGWERTKELDTGLGKNVQQQEW